MVVWLVQCAWFEEVDAELDEKCSKEPEPLGVPLKVVCYLRITSNILVRGLDVRHVDISDQEELDSLQHMYVSVHSLDRDSITCRIDWFDCH